MGAPMTMVSAASSSATSLSDSTSASLCSGERSVSGVARAMAHVSVIWGRGSRARSRTVTSVSPSCAMIRSVRPRVTELVVLAEESMRKIDMGGYPFGFALWPQHDPCLCERNW